MKKNLYRVILCLLLTGITTQYTHAKGGSILHDISFNRDELTLDTICNPESGTFLYIYSKNLHADCGIEGAVALPMKQLMFRVPVYSNGFKIEAICGKTESLGVYNPYYVQLMPVANSFRDRYGILDESRLDEAVKNELYSKRENLVAEVVSEGWFNGCEHIVTVAVYPVCYGGEPADIRFNSEISLKLSYEECSESELAINPPIFTRPESRLIKANDFVVNPDFEDSYDKRFRAVQSSTGIESMRKYYIITPESLKNAVLDLAIWKRQKGLDVTVKTIEEILSTPIYQIDASTGIVDNAAALRAYLYDEFSREGSFYCLLIGDYRTSMPFRYVYIEDMIKHYGPLGSPDILESGSYTPSDRYFSEIIDGSTGNIYLQNIGSQYVYLYTPKELYSPDILLGRLLCHTEEEIRNYTYKLRIYEAWPGFGDDDYLNRASGFENMTTKATSYIGDGEFKYQFQELQNNGFFTDFTFLGDEEENTAKGNVIIQSMSNSGISLWNGHGSPYTILLNRINYGSGCIIFAHDNDPYYINSNSYTKVLGSSLNWLGNDKKPFIAFARSCSTCPIDLHIDIADNWYREYNVEYTMGGSFTVGAKNYGGVAYIGNTRASTISYGILTSKGFLDNLINHRNISKAFLYGQLCQYQKYERTICHLIGEPEFEVWLKKPERFSSDIIEIDGDYVYFNTNEVQGSTVSVFDGSSTVLYDKNMEIDDTIYLPQNFSEGCYSLSVWKRDFLPEIWFIGCSGTLSGKQKKFFVKKALLGDDGIDGLFLIGGAGLNVKASDAIKCGSKLLITDNSQVNLESETTTTLSGSQIKNNASVNISASEVVLDKGFCVEKGSTININSKD